MKSSMKEMENIWERQANLLRSPLEICSGLSEKQIDSRLFRSQIKGDFAGVLEELGIMLIVSREYEHFILALSGKDGRLHFSYWPVPHPSGLVVDRKSNLLYVAATRNPNQIITFKPQSYEDFTQNSASHSLKTILLPIQTNFLPGSTYLHDLALIENKLFANSVGKNTVVRIEGSCVHQSWWPRCVDTPDGPDTSKNYLQLNGIASGKTIHSSYFCASTDTISYRRPGHRNFKVDGQGVVFSGKTREVSAKGLTRPHSIRLDTKKRLFICNSGYGKVCQVNPRSGAVDDVAIFPGWTRGLCIINDVAFVGTSRILKRFHHYAPGLDAEQCICGLHAFHLTSGKNLGSIIWPFGNQIFAIDWISSSFANGFPLKRSRINKKALTNLFFSY